MNRHWKKESQAPYPVNLSRLYALLFKGLEDSAMTKGRKKYEDSGIKIFLVLIRTIYYTYLNKNVIN